jgi:hypothetical protein
MEAISPMKTPSPGASLVAWIQRGAVLHFVASMAAGQGRRAPDGEGRSSGEQPSAEPAPQRLRGCTAAGPKGRGRGEASCAPARPSRPPPSPDGEGRRGEVGQVGVEGRLGAGVWRVAT